MSIDVSLALREAGDRLTTASGMLVATLFVLAGLIELVVTQTIMARAMEAMAGYPALSTVPMDRVRNQLTSTVPFDLGIDLQVAAVGFLAVFLLVIVFRVIAIRVFAAAEDGGFPTQAVKYRFFVALLFVLLFEVVLIATTAVLLVGPAFVGGALSDPRGSSGGLLVLALYLLVLGAFLALPIFLYFARQEMVLNESNTIAAIGTGYGLVKENLGAVFVLLAAIFVLNLVGGLAIGTATGGTDLTPFLTTVYHRFVVVFGIAVSTRAYLQTR